MHVFSLIPFFAGISAQEGSPSPHSQGFVDLLFPLLLVFLIFYFILIRPQQKKMKVHRDFLGGLKKGDEVVTDGGILGRIVGLTDKVATLEVSDNIRIKVMKEHISGPRPEEKPPA